MSIPDDVREAQRDLSAVAERLLDAAEARSEPLPAWPFARDETTGWLDDEPYVMQRWPTFIDAAKRERIARATEGVVALAKSLHERVFDGDPERIAEFYGLDDEVFALLWLEPPNGLDGAIGRCDFIDGPQGFRCLELNLAGNLGGWEIHYTVPWLLAQPFVAEVLAAAGARPVYRSPIESFFRHVAEDGVRQQLSSDGRLDLAFLVYQGCVLPPAGVETLSGFYRRVLEGLDYGLTGELRVLRSATELAEGDEGELLANGRRVHALVEYNGELDTPRAAFRAFKAEMLALYNGPVTPLLVDKRNLALLSELEDSDRLDAAERAIVRDHVPWGRVVRPGTTRFQGEVEDLLPLLKARREEFVLKRAQGLGGDQVVIGRALEAAAWEQAVERAADGRWMVQEFQPSHPYAYPDPDGRWAQHDAVWGTFCFGDSYGGAVMRLGPRGAAEALNSELGATVSPVLEV